MSKNYPSKLLWLDLEMTGLDPVNDRILEVGAIVTDFKFKEFDSFTAVIKQSDKVLSRMKTAAWYDFTGGKRVKKGTVYDMASQNGLVERVSQGLDEMKTEELLVEVVKKHFNQLAVLAGNSIHQDRRFIRQWWPNLEKLLHYRMLDVSSFKVWMQGAYSTEFKKPDQHRALEDIRGSISELKYYLRKLT
jgi:oligoribonuclease